MSTDTYLSENFLFTLLILLERHVVEIFWQVLEEPGKDTSKFDTIMPTVVRPCTKDTFTSSEVSHRR